MIRKLALMATLLIGLIAVAAAVLPRTPAPAGARLYIIEPQEGAVVASPVTVRFGLSGMGVAPAGVEKEATGHHHLLIDVAQMPALDQPLPTTDHIVHFGGGQTEATIELAPGQHTLQLVLGDMSHVPHEPPVISAKITITVE
jgi:hypothetical protein